MRGKRRAVRPPPRWGGSQRLVSFSPTPCRGPAWRWGRGPCWGGCRPDSVALWFTRDKSRSRPATTVEAAAASQGHRVPTFSDSAAGPAASRPRDLEASSKPVRPSPAVSLRISKTAPQKAGAVHKLNLVSHTDSVSAPQLCCRSRKADINCASELRGWVPIKLYLHTQAGGQICSAASSWSIPDPTGPGEGGQGSPSPQLCKA